MQYADFKATMLNNMDMDNWNKVFHYTTNFDVQGGANWTHFNWK